MGEPIKVLVIPAFVRRLFLEFVEATGLVLRCVTWTIACFRRYSDDAEVEYVGTKQRRVADVLLSRKSGKFLYVQMALTCR